MKQKKTHDIYCQGKPHNAKPKRCMHRRVFGQQQRSEYHINIHPDSVTAMRWKNVNKYPELLYAWTAVR